MLNALSVLIYELRMICLCEQRAVDNFNAMTRRAFAASCTARVRSWLAVLCVTALAFSGFFHAMSHVQKPIAAVEAVVSGDAKADDSDVSLVEVSHCHGCISAPLPSFAGATSRPDAAFVYSGHNRYLAPSGLLLGDPPPPKA